MTPDNEEKPKVICLLEGAAARALLGVNRATDVRERIVICDAVQFFPIPHSAPGGRSKRWGTCGRHLCERRMLPDEDHDRKDPCGLHGGEVERFSVHTGETAIDMKTVRNRKRELVESVIDMAETVGLSVIFEVKGRSGTSRLEGTHLLAAGGLVPDTDTLIIGPAGNPKQSAVICSP